MPGTQEQRPAASRASGNSRERGASRTAPALGTTIDIAGLVAELTERSAEFHALWADHTVGALSRAFKVFVHPEAGRVELTYQTFDVHDAPGQQLLVGTPEPGSRSEEAIAYLASMATPA